VTSTVLHLARVARPILRRIVAICAVVLAVAVVTTVTVDLGPVLGAGSSWSKTS
jgi:hypothetical protein